MQNHRPHKALSGYLLAISVYLLWMANFVVADSSAIEEGEISGTLGRISCAIQSDARLRLQRTSNERVLALKKARALQKNIRRATNILKRQTKVTKKLIGNIGRSSRSAKRAQVIFRDGEATLSDLSRKIQRKLAKIERRVMALELMELEFQPSTSISEIDSDLATLQELLDEQGRLLKEANKALRCCKGCAVDVLSNVRSFQRSQEESVSRSTRSKKSCECITKSIPASLVMFTENYPEDASLCSVVVFIEWSDDSDKHADDWVAVYNFGPNKVETRKSLTEFADGSDSIPFDNILNLGNGLVFQAGQGINRALLGTSGVDAPENVVADCSQIAANVAKAYGASASVEVTICPE